MSSVRVYCRMRPFNNREKGLGNLQCPFEIQTNEIFLPSKNKSYFYDRCFGSPASQHEVFGAIGYALVDDFMGGFNATQFVYGQTGSGKTWTMMGDKSKPDLCGVIPRTAALIFDRIREKEDGWRFSMEISYLEIFMERVNDLLDGTKENLDVKESSNGVYVPGLTKESMGTLADVYNVIERGDSIRKVAETQMNANSSRSHSVLSIYLEQTSPTGQQLVSQINLVDLAGSERIEKTNATGEVLKQGTLINLSLTVLAQVISGLSKMAEGGNTVVPYRQSKLTRLLQTSLGGNAKTGLSIHISPHEDNVPESISTLEFGKRAKLIKNQAVARVIKSAAQLEKELDIMQEQFGQLCRMIERMAGNTVLDALLKGRILPKVDQSALPEIARQQDLALNPISQSSPGDLVALKNQAAALENEMGTQRTRNDKLTTQIMSLTEKVQLRDREITELEQDLNVAELEVTAASHKVKRARVAHDDLQRSVDEARAIAEKEAKAEYEEEVSELNGLLAKQTQMVTTLRVDIDELREDNNELENALAERTSRLALAEIKLMKYEVARSMTRQKSKASGLTRDSSTTSFLPPMLASVGKTISQSVNKMRPKTEMDQPMPLPEIKAAPTDPQHNSTARRSRQDKPKVMIVEEEAPHDHAPENLDTSNISRQRSASMSPKKSEGGLAPPECQALAPSGGDSSARKFRMGFFLSPRKKEDTKPARKSFGGFFR
eukprot:c20836_g1_i1.p1 GENE.c20836_g1_i1~~c20836_g1_i1.p1  ORF type:complete len:720 (+),score=153.56 c20836_g1_i1:78-2237(+)